MIENLSMLFSISLLLGIIFSAFFGDAVSKNKEKDIDDSDPDFYL